MILVDSLDAVMVSRHAGAHGRYATDNPLLVGHPILGDAAVDLDATISDRDERRLGKFAVDLAMEIDELLDCSEIADAYGLVRGHIRLAAKATRLLSGQIYRTAALARGLAGLSPKSVSIFAIDHEPKNGVPSLVPDRFQSPWPRLARLGFFGPIVVDLVGVETDLPQVINDTASRSFARRLVGLPLSAVLGVFSTKSWFSAIMRHLGGPSVIVVGDNESIRETLGYLTLNRVSVIVLQSFRTRIPDQKIGLEQRPDLLVSSRLVPFIANRLSQLNEFSECQVDALAKMIAWHYAGGIETAAQRISELKKQFSETLRRMRPPIAVLANAVVGIHGAHLHALCREHGVTLFDFEHGVTTGLSRHSESKLRFSEAVNCDELMVCSRSASCSFEKSDANETIITVIGLPDQVRRMRRPKLQRWLSRRALGIRFRHPVVMHVCTASFQGNMRAGPFAHRESDVVALNRQLIQNVYGRISGWDVLFKDYPTQRFPYEPECAVYAGTPPRLFYVGEEDFRYLRAAADVIVTMMPTSTLGWCVGADTPLVWLDSPVTPLLNVKQTEAFREAFLFVDMHKDDWCIQLVKLLSAGIDGLREQWRAKASARKRHLETYIIGPPMPPGKAAAARILGRQA